MNPPDAPRVRPYLAILRARTSAPQFDFGEGTLAEYHQVRIDGLMRRADEAFRDIRDVEHQCREVLRRLYAEETFDLKWLHRQQQLEDRRRFDSVESAARSELAASEERARLDAYDRAVAHLRDVDRLETIRRRAAVHEQTTVLRDAVLAAEQKALEWDKAVDDLWQRELTHRDELRHRAGIEQAEAEDALKLWDSGHHGLAHLAMEEQERSARANVIAVETATRHAVISFTHISATLHMAESLYRSRLAENDEPRSREALLQRHRRDMEFARWQTKISAADLLPPTAGETFTGLCLPRIVPHRNADRRV